MIEIPENHPRKESLSIRHALIEGMHLHVVAEAGLIAHGRGEAFDYLLGEKTHDFAIQAIDAAAALLYLSEHPIISVNGNTSVLCPDEMIQFSRTTGIPLEVNLFYRNKKRMDAIQKLFIQKNYPEVLGFDPNFHTQVSDLSSARRIVDTRGIHVADSILIPLEDGDRTEVLVKEGKKVITIDLNPLSRTSQAADITIVDNVTRVFPLLLKAFREIPSSNAAKDMLVSYDNDQVIQSALMYLASFWVNQK
ncbi:MAG: phosphopantothenate/pantothenate synthetase [Candidatus Kariarchaeaceae archaeon]|jgi:4-phosphopantoate--beta-alanine ligase